jgi:hypothetical protein
MNDSQKSNLLPPNTDFNIFMMGFVIGLLVVTLLFIFTSPGENAFQNRAVESGVGEYYIDPNNNKAFRFLTEEPE